MLSLSLCVVLCVGLASGLYSDDTNPSQDEADSYILFDVSAHKGSAGDLKTAFNSLKNVEYAFKVIGEERAFFIVPNNEDCETVQSDFHGLKVDSAPLLKGNNTVAEFNKTGLVVVRLVTSTDAATLEQIFEDALAECGDCFKVFVVIGRRPQTCILVGNIPLDLVDRITIDAVTADPRDHADTDLVINFNHYVNKHATGCIDLHQPHAQPQIQPLKTVRHPIDIHAFPGKSAVHQQPHIPIHNAFPSQGKVEDPHFRKINFPSIGKGGYSNTQSDFDPHFNFDHPPTDTTYF